MIGCAHMLKKLQQSFLSGIMTGKRACCPIKTILYPSNCFLTNQIRAKRAKKSELLALFFVYKKGAVVQKLLSSLLSLCLLVSSVSPSLAQVVPFNVVVRAGSTGAVKIAGTEALKAGLLREIVQQQSLVTVKGFGVAGLSLPQAQAVSSSILRTATGVQPAKLHNDWVGLAVNFEDIARTDGTAAKTLLTEDLAKKQTVFAQIPHKELSAFLESVSGHARTQAIANVQDALADASALALVGNKEDINALLSFYQAAKGSIFEQTAGVIVARGLLRYGQYEALNKFLAQAGNLGEFTDGIIRYAKEKNVDLTVSQQPAKAVKFPAALQTFLEQEGFFHGLHANPSYEATRAWAELGKKQADLAKKQDVLPLPKQKVVPLRSPRVSLGAVEIPAAIQLANRVTVSTPQNTLADTKRQVISSATEPAQKQKPAAPAAQTKPAAMDNSGVLYSGIPVFAIEKGIKNLLAKLRSKREARANKKAKFEEADLHENTVYPVYKDAEPVTVNEAEDVLSVAQAQPVTVEKDGYKLTLEDKNSIEHILRNVSLSVSPMLEQFSSEYNRLTLTTDHIFELRNQVIAPTRPDHFFFALNPENGALETLIKGASALKMARPLRIKIQQTTSPRKEVSLKLYADDSLSDFVWADVEKTLLPGSVEKDGLNGYLVQRDGKVYYVSPKGSEEALDKYFVRLPKGESKYWTKIFADNPDTEFALTLYSTQEKTFAWTYLVPMMQIGLGKTMAPELASRTPLGEATSSIIMMSINNVLPVLMGFVHKSLKRYGEAAIGRIGVGSFLAGSAVALGSGLYGMLGDGLMGPWQTAGFVTSSVLMAIGTNITRFVQNILITANRGKIVAQDSFKNAPKKAASGDGAEVTYNGAYLTKRVKEVFAKSPKGAARDVVLFQTASMFKNLGTMLFLSFPWLANGAVKLTTGLDLNLDFSASYVPYSLFSAWTLYKVCKTAYKDAFPNKLNLLDNNLQETKQQVFNKILDLKPEEITAGNPVIVNAAKQLKAAIDAISPVEARETGKKTADVIAQYEKEIPEGLALESEIQGMRPEIGGKAMVTLDEALQNLGRRDVRVIDVLKMTGIPASLAAMTLATFHELAVSNGFAFGMHAIVGRGATANALTALALYGSMSAGRILGNMLSRRVSGGTMYAVSSAMSVMGTALMAAADGNMGALISGAVIASFGVGNFFSQMYEYMTGLYPKSRREIALLINYTMPAAAVMTFPMRWLVGYTGISNLDLLISGAGLLGSLALTPGMFANSSIVKAAQHSFKNTKTALRNLLNKKQPETNMGDALPN